MMPVPETTVFYSSGVHYLQLPMQYLISDLVAGFLFIIGMVYLAGVMKIFMGGDEVRRYASIPVVGMLLYTLFHQGGEFACESTLHGGFPTNFVGSLHIVIFQSVGGVVFLFGSILFYLKMRALVKGE
jgi:hypothetical protein